MNASHRLLGADRRSQPRAGDLSNVPLEAFGIVLSRDEVVAVRDALRFRKKEVEDVYPTIDATTRRLFESWVADIDSVLTKLPE